MRADALHFGSVFFFPHLDLTRQCLLKIRAFPAHHLPGA